MSPFQEPGCHGRPGRAITQGESSSVGQEGSFPCRSLRLGFAPPGLLYRPNSELMFTEFPGPHLTLESEVNIWPKQPQHLEEQRKQLWPRGGILTEKHSARVLKHVVREPIALNSLSLLRIHL
ncbi:unnamed protein product [Lepidochelys kempii]